MEGQGTSKVTEDEVTSLESILLSKYAPGSLYVHYLGHGDYGLRVITDCVARATGGIREKVARVNVGDMLSLSQLYGSILNQFSGWTDAMAWENEKGRGVYWNGEQTAPGDGRRKRQKKTKAEETTTLEKRRLNDSFESFTIGMRSLLENDARRFIIMEQSERLLDLGMPGTAMGGEAVMASFIRLAEIVDSKICVIFVSRRPYVQLLTSVPGLETHTEVVELHGPDEHTVKKILECRFKDAYPEATEETIALYKGLLDLVYASVEGHVGNDVDVIAEFLSALWPMYVKPVEKGTVRRDQIAKLQMNIRQPLQAKLKGMDIRSEVRSAEGQRHQERFELVQSMPKLAQFLLLASVYASFNPKRVNDNIVRNKGARPTTRRLRKAVTRGPEVENDAGHEVERSRVSRRKDLPAHVLGPAVFTEELMLLLFWRIVPVDLAEYARSSGVLMQLRTLENVGLLKRVGERGARRYKCSLTFDVADMIGHALKYSWREHLHEGENQ